ncbi:MAG: hypothetical protein L3K17_00845 [Thermoplasmata archaeon]|nr:hypothetical protein [Thermoplasmata archaeon]
MNASWVDLTNWVNGSPPWDEGFAGASLVYDAGQNETLLIGANATWRYGAGRWTDITSAVGSNGNGTEDGALTAYDARDGYVLQYGGCGSTGGNVAHDADGNWTWALVNGSWRNLTAETLGSPVGACGPSFAEMSYDAADRVVVLLVLPESQLYHVPYNGTSQTWTYSRGSWKNITATAGPAPPAGQGGMSYDATDNYLVAFDAPQYNPNGTETYQNRTWKFQNDTWTQLRTPGPSPSRQSSYTLSYDPLLHGIIYAEGEAGFLNTTWLFSGGSWTDITSELGGQAPPSSDSTVFAFTVFDAADSYLLMVRGDTQTWALGVPPPFAALHVAPSPVELDRPTKLQVTTVAGAPPLRFNYSGLPPGCATVNSPTLFCSPISAGAYSIVVTVTDLEGRWVNASATLIAEVGGPQVTSAAAIPESVHVGQVANLSVNVTGGIAPYTFAWSGLPYGCSPGNTTGLTCAPELPGDYSIECNVSDTQGANASVRLSLSAYPFPTTRPLTVAATTIDLGDALKFLAVAQGGATPLSYSWAGLPPGCPASSTLALTCVPEATGHFAVNFTVIDKLGARAGTPTVSVTVNSNPTILALNISPSQVAAGKPVQIQVQTAGGTPPVSVRWGGLPPECSGVTASFTCTPETAGNYSVAVEVSDAFGHSANASGILDVASLPGTVPLTLTEQVAIGVISATVALAVIGVWYRSRKRTPARRPEPPVGGVS